MRVRHGSFLVFFVERRKLKESSENGTKRAIDILLRCHGLMALSRLESYVKAEHPLEESHWVSDKDKVSIDKTPQAYKTLVAERKFEEGIDNNRDVLHQCRFLSIPTDIVALGKPIRVVQSPINPTPGLLHLNILCVPEGLVNKMLYSSWFGKSLCWTSIIL